MPVNPGPVSEEFKQQVLRAVSDDFIKDVDGFFVYWPDRIRGALNAIAMRVIADHLDEINKPWADQIDRDFKEQPDA